VRYENGASDFLQVLTAERTLLETEDRLARSRAEAATSLIAVYKSLGGGWEAAPSIDGNQAIRTAQAR
jgi:multidrug efflux system outer membrane protein